jgi:hypothetical protein
VEEIRDAVTPEVVRDGGALLVITLVAAGVATGKSQATGRELKIGVPLALTGPIAARRTASRATSRVSASSCTQTRRAANATSAWRM